MDDTQIPLRTRRLIAAFHTTLFLDDLVAALREQQFNRQREKDGNPAEVESC